MSLAFPAFYCAVLQLRNTESYTYFRTESSNSALVSSNSRPSGKPSSVFCVYDFKTLIFTNLVNRIPWTQQGQSVVPQIQENLNLNRQNMHDCLFIHPHMDLAMQSTSVSKDCGSEPPRSCIWTEHVWMLLSLFISWHSLTTNYTKLSCIRGHTFYRGVTYMEGHVTTVCEHYTT